MTYTMSEGLQRAVYQRLSDDVDVASLVGSAIFDAAPAIPPDLFVALGPEKVRSLTDATGRGAVHEVQISVVTRQNGYSGAKALAAAISAALEDAPLPMSRGRVVSIRFLRAQARRDEGEAIRRIDLWFRARLDESAA